MKYDLSFNDMLSEIIDSTNWYQGENFRSGVIIYYDFDYQTVAIKEYDGYSEKLLGNFFITKHNIHQKYCKINTIEEAQKRKTKWDN